MKPTVHDRISLLIRSIGFALVVLLPPACSNQGKPAVRHDEVILDTQTGDATFYASNFQGGKTASGRKLDNRKAVAAHLTYPFGTVARVTDLRTGRSVNVVIIDRGPFGKNRREGAIIDLSRDAALNLGIISEGQVKVKVEVLAWGDGEHLKSGQPTP